MLKDGKRKIRIILTLALILVLLNIAALIFITYIIDDVFIYPADVFASDKVIGFNLDKDKIHFGLVPKNAESSERKITIQNLIGEKRRVIVTADGELKNWLVIKIDGKPKNDFYLEPLEMKTVVLSAARPEDVITNKTYDGNIKVYFLKPFFSLV